MGGENFWSLLQDPAHWEFELFLMFIFDVLLGAVLWPCLKRWRRHHSSDDRKIARLERSVLLLRLTSRRKSRRGFTRLRRAK
jgi:hypothetical protein